MKQFLVPPDINYIAAFLTFRCRYGCRYCINKHGNDLVMKRSMPADNWIKGLNRFIVRPDLPITIQGGEPTQHSGFYQIINSITPSIPIDILTNLDFNVKDFTHFLSPKRLRRVSKYASIRISYHHEQVKYIEFMEKVMELIRAGFHVGVFEVDRPEIHSQVLYRKEVALEKGIDWRIKEFLGPWKGRLHGTFKYPGAVNSEELCHCKCRTNEILIDPAGFIFRCHSDLYANRNPICHILDENLPSINFREWRDCSLFGKCNACDVKTKTNRFQVYGHTSVEIKNISKPYNVTIKTERS